MMGMISHGNNAESAHTGTPINKMNENHENERVVLNPYVTHSCGQPRIK